MEKTLEIQNKSKVIAEYMGYKYYPWNAPDNPAGRGGWYKGTGKSMSYLGRKVSEFRFYNSWDAIIPVYEKLLQDNQFCESKWYVILQDKLAELWREEFFNNCYNAIIELTKTSRLEIQISRQEAIQAAGYNIIECQNCSTPIIISFADDDKDTLCPTCGTPHKNEDSHDLYHR